MGFGLKTLLSCRPPPWPSWCPPRWRRCLRRAPQTCGTARRRSGRQTPPPWSASPPSCSQRPVRRCPCKGLSCVESIPFIAHLMCVLIIFFLATLHKVHWGIQIPKSRFRILTFCILHHLSARNNAEQIYTNKVQVSEIGKISHHLTFSTGMGNHYESNDFVQAWHLASGLH